MKKLLSVGLLIFALGWVSFVTVSQMRIQAVTNSKVEPFTVEFYERSLNNASGNVMERREIIARRSDGSHAAANISVLDRHMLIRRVNLIPERISVLVADAISAKSTHFMSNRAEVPTIKGPLDRTCMTHPELVNDSYSVLGRDVLLNLNVIKLVSETKAARTETWEAPALGCYAIKDIREWKNDDGSISGRTEKTAVAVDLGEPSGDLFDIPSHYLEKLPSALILELEATKGRFPSMTPGLQRADSNYELSRQRNAK
jgi:hypothetical protein